VVRIPWSGEEESVLSTVEIEDPKTLCEPKKGKRGGQNALRDRRKRKKISVAPREEQAREKQFIGKEETRREATKEIASDARPSGKTGREEKTKLLLYI